MIARFMFFYKPGVTLNELYVVLGWLVWWCLGLCGGAVKEVVSSEVLKM